MKFRYNKAIEACSALFCYATWDRQSDFMRSRNVLWPKELILWKKEADTSLPDILKPMINEMVSEFILLFFSLVKLAVIRNISSVHTLIENLKILDEKEFVDLVILGETFSKNSEELMHNPQEGVREILNADGSARPGEELRFRDFLSHPGTYRDALVLMLTVFYKETLQTMEEHIAAEMETRIEADRVLCRDNPVEFCMSYMKMDIPDKVDKPEDETLCFISWYNCWDVNSHSDPSFVIYGMNSHRHNEGPSAEDIYTLLNDKTRRKIIKLLSHKKMYSRELASELGITSATVSYHMSRMFSLGLIYQQAGEKKRMYHCLKKERLDQLFAVLKNELIV